MLKKVFVWILAAMLAFSNVGCTSVPQPTMEELLAEVNAEHQAVDKGIMNASQYVGDLVDQDLRWSYYPKENTAEYDSEKILTQQQAIEDVTYLFDAFHDCYGPYEYFGGAEVFDAVEETIKAELQTKETLIAADLEQILLENLAFIKDGHFSINMKRANPTKIPFFFHEVAFVKTEEGYQAINGRKLESVEGYDNLDELMKRSISQEGKLVYYPVLLKDCDFWEALKSPQTCDERNSLSLRTLFAASSLGEGAFGSTARRLTLPEGGFSVFFTIMLSIAPRGGAVNKAAGKRKKRWKISIALLAPLA